MIMTSALLLLASIRPLPIVTKSVRSPVYSQQTYKNWVDAPHNDSWSLLKTDGKLTDRVYKPSETFTGFIVGDQRDSFDYGIENRRKDGESIGDYLKRVEERQKESQRRFKLGVPLKDNYSSVFFVGFEIRLRTGKSRQVLLYIDSTPKDDTTKVGSVIFHYGDSDRILQELDGLLNLARRWRADGNNHDEREKSFTYGSEYSDQFTVKISQRPSSDNLMWQVLGKNGTEFTSRYTKSFKDAPIKKFLTDSKGNVIREKDGTLKALRDDGFSEFSMFVNQLRTVVSKLDAIQ